MRSSRADSVKRRGSALSYVVGKTIGRYAIRIRLVCFSMCHIPINWIDLREKHIGPGGFGINVRKAEAVGQRHSLGIYRCSADYKYLLIRSTGLKGFGKRAEHLRTGPRSTLLA